MTSTETKMIWYSVLFSFPFVALPPVVQCFPLFAWEMLTFFIQRNCSELVRTFIYCDISHHRGLWFPKCAAKSFASYLLTRNGIIHKWTKWDVTTLSSSSSFLVLLLAALSLSTTRSSLSDTFSQRAFQRLSSLCYRCNCVVFGYLIQPFSSMRGATLSLSYIFARQY